MKKCNCYSTIDGNGQESIRAKAPKWSRKEWISIDVCVWPFVKALWDANIQTCGSCCGHGKEQPSVVLAHYKDISNAITVSLDSGNVDVKIFAWKDGQIDVYYGDVLTYEKAIQELL